MELLWNYHITEMASHLHWNLRQLQGRSSEIRESHTPQERTPQVPNLEGPVIWRWKSIEIRNIGQKMPKVEKLDEVVGFGSF